MSNQPDQPQPYPGQPQNNIPPGYNAPTLPPQYQEPQYQEPQYPEPQHPYGQQQFSNPQAPPHGAPAYYQGGPGYPTSAGPRGLSLTSMILGLASLVVGAGFFIVPQIVGIVLGHLGLSKENPQGRAFAITGLITSYLALVIFGGIYLLFIIGISSAGSSYDS